MTQRCMSAQVCSVPLIMASGISSERYLGLAFWTIILMFFVTITISYRIYYNTIILYDSYVKCVFSLGPFA